MYSYHHNLLPSSFHDLFLSSNQVHQYKYKTLLASLYRPRFCRTNIKQFSILYRGPKIWNSLPISLISSPSIFGFKKNLKNYLLIADLSLDILIFLTLHSTMNLVH